MRVQKREDPFLTTNVHKEPAVVTFPAYRCCTQMMAVVSSSRAAVQRSTMRLFEAPSPVWTLLCCRLFKIVRFTNICSAVLRIKLPERSSNCRCLSALIFCQIRALTQKSSHRKKKPSVESFISSDQRSQFLLLSVPPWMFFFAWHLSLTDGSHESNSAQIKNLFFGCKATAYSPSVIVSAGIDNSNTPKTSFVCDEHPHPPETKGTERNEKLILLCPDKHVTMQQTSLPVCYKCTVKCALALFLLIMLLSS